MVQEKEEVERQDLYVWKSVVSCSRSSLTQGGLDALVKSSSCVGGARGVRGAGRKRPRTVVCTADRVGVQPVPCDLDAHFRLDVHRREVPAERLPYAVGC